MSETNVNVVDVAAFVENQQKLNSVINQFMDQTGRTLMVAEETSKQIINELRSLREGSNMKRKLDEADISLTVEQDIEDEVHSAQEDEEEALWGQRESGDNGPSTSAETELEEEIVIDEGTLRSKYGNLLQQTEEVLGEAIKPDLANVIQKTWGRSLLSQTRKKDLIDGTMVPSNAKALQTPQLNTAIHIRLSENHRTKDRGAQERQKCLSRAAIPLFYSIIEIDSTRDILEKNNKYARLLEQCNNLEDTKKYLKAIMANQNKMKKSLEKVNEKTMHTIKVLNYNYTSTTRKRKQDVTAGLGTSFKVYAQDTQHGEYLFTIDTMKAMKSELKHIKPKEESAKNVNHSNKSQWSGPQGNRFRNSAGSSKPKYRKQYNNQNFNNNNYNNNNNNNNKFKGKR